MHFDKKNRSYQNRNVHRRNNIVRWPTVDNSAKPAPVRPRHGQVSQLKSDRVAGDILYAICYCSQNWPRSDSLRSRRCCSGNQEAVNMTPKGNVINAVRIWSRSSSVVGFPVSN